MKIYNKQATLEHIKTEIQKKGIPQSKIAEILHIDRCAISRKLNGLRDFKLQEIIIISELLEMELTEVLIFDDVNGGDD